MTHAKTTLTSHLVPMWPWRRSIKRGPPAHMRSHNVRGTRLMSRRKTIALVVAAASIGASGLLASPAFAAGGCSSNCSGSTNVTFALGSSSGLSISIPSNADVDLGSATSNVLGTSVSGSLHPTTVTDTRGSLLAAWTRRVSTSGFNGSGTGAGQTIAANRASMSLDSVALLSDAVALATG